MGEKMTMDMAIIEMVEEHLRTNVSNEAALAYSVGRMWEATFEQEQFAKEWNELVRKENGKKTN